MEKSAFIHMRVQPDIKEAAREAAEAKNSNLTKEITAFLKRLGKRGAGAAGKE